MDLHLIRQKAKSGDGLSAYILGRAYYSSELGLKTDYAKSFDWYKFGYEKLNDPRCEYGFAMFYFDDGESENEGIVKKDNEFADKLFTETYPKLVALAKNGDMYSNFILGAYHNYGIGGVKKDFSTALKYIKQSADLGHSGACYDMGKFYAEGRGVKPNLEQARKYFKKASKMGNIRAQMFLDKEVRDGLSNDNGNEMN